MRQSVWKKVFGLRSTTHKASKPQSTEITEPNHQQGHIKQEMEDQKKPSQSQQDEANKNPHNPHANAPLNALLPPHTRPPPPPQRSPHPRPTNPQQLQPTTLAPQNPHRPSSKTPFHRPPRSSRPRPKTHYSPHPRLLQTLPLRDGKESVRAQRVRRCA